MGNLGEKELIKILKKEKWELDRINGSQNILKQAGLK
jgi:predicted RNA binding protein YcfA (HicA-like mRNA interferase family)